MRTLFTFLLLTFSLSSLADTHAALYEAAGWPEQRQHFSETLNSVQQRYKDTLPPAVFQALVNNSNQRFESSAMDSRAQAALRQNLGDAQPALAFFESELGRKIVQAEVLATRRDQLNQHANGLPRMQAGSNRQLLIRHLAQAIPASQGAAEVSLALAGVAADSLSQMMPGLLGGGQTQGLLESQRQRLTQQVEADIDNTLLYVYRELSDAELQEYVDFAQSEAGQAYYQATLQALRAALKTAP